MKFETIKKVILAAILLPFVFMLIEGVVVIRASVTQYRDLEKDRQFADVLARGGSIAATEILSEIGATRLYLARPNSRTAADMQQSRVTLDHERRAFMPACPPAMRSTRASSANYQFSALPTVASLPRAAPSTRGVIPAAIRVPSTGMRLSSSLLSSMRFHR